MSYLENFQAEQEHIYSPISKECCWGKKISPKMKDALTSTENNDCKFCFLTSKNRVENKGYVLFSIRHNLLS